MGIGEILKTTREKAGLSLEDVSLATYIRKSYLEALEEENFAVIPGTIYVKGLLRNYGDFLGLSGIGLVDRWNEACGSNNKPTLVAVKKSREKRYIENTRRVESLGRKRVKRQRKRRWNRVEWAIIIGVCTIITLLLVWIFW